MVILEYFLYISSHMKSFKTHHEIPLDPIKSLRRCHHHNPIHPPWNPAEIDGTNFRSMPGHWLTTWQVARAAVTQELSGGFDQQRDPKHVDSTNKKWGYFLIQWEKMMLGGFKNFKRSGSKQRRSLVFQDQLVVLMGKDDETSISRTEARWSTSLRSWKRTGSWHLGPEGAY